MAAVVESLGMAVLAADHGLEPGRHAVLAEIGEQPRIGLRQGFRGPIGGTDRLSEMVVTGVLRQCLVEIDEVTVQVDVVFVHPAQPGEAVRIDRMDQQHGDVLGQVAVESAAQAADLGGGAAEALDPMRAGGHHQQVARLRRARCAGCPAPGPRRPVPAGDARGSRPRDRGRPQRSGTATAPRRSCLRRVALGRHRASRPRPAPARPPGAPVRRPARFRDGRHAP